MADRLDSDVIAGNVRAVLERIHRAAERAGRRPGEVRLVAVTKSVPADRVRAALEAGVGILGESRLQEAIPKMDRLGPREGLVWHFIGRLQRRKVRSVVGRFKMIHSVESVDLASEIDRRAGEQGSCQAVLLEVNLGAEPTKVGFSPEVLTESVVALDRMTNLAVKGLMVIPPLTGEVEASRVFFRRLREHAERLARLGLSRVRMDELSMGMSQDFEIAVEEGATLVRVGTAIFGPRPA